MAESVRWHRCDGDGQDAAVEASGLTDGFFFLCGAVLGISAVSGVVARNDDGWPELVALRLSPCFSPSGGR
jgi:hypothetical protein